MPEIARPQGNDPKINIHLKWTPHQLAEAWMAIANYNAYRDSDLDEEITILPPDHPLIYLQMFITDQLPELIMEGIKNGWNVEPLTTIQSLIAQAIHDVRSSSGENGPVPE